MIKNIMMLFALASIVFCLSYIDGKLDREAQLRQQRLNVIYSAYKLPN